MTTRFLNNRYQILQVLGTAGFGETFLAEDTYLPSRRRCVIKQLKPVTNNPQMYQMVQQRFQRDRYTTASQMLNALNKSTFTPPEPSNQAAVLLSPTTKTSSQGNWRKALILGMLLLAVGLIVILLLSKTRAPDAPSAPVRGRRDLPYISVWHAASISLIQRVLEDVEIRL